LHLRKALDNKENNDDKDVELFLSELITRLINDGSYQSDEVIYQLFLVSFELFQKNLIIN